MRDYTGSENSDDVYAELATREHVPNKLEAYLSRRKKTNKKKKMKYDRCVSNHRIKGQIV